MKLRMPLESPFRFYPKYVWETLSKTARFLWLLHRYDRILKRVNSDPGLQDYTDPALAPADGEDQRALELLNAERHGAAENTPGRHAATGL